MSAPRSRARRRLPAAPCAPARHCAAGRDSAGGARHHARRRGRLRERHDRAPRRGHLCVRSVDADRRRVPRRSPPTACARSCRAIRSSIYIGQGWDKPLGPIEVVPGVMLEASLEDLQGRFNLNNLVKTRRHAGCRRGAPPSSSCSAMLGLEPKWAGYIIDWIDRDVDAEHSGRRRGQRLHGADARPIAPPTATSPAPASSWRCRASAATAT